MQKDNKKIVVLGAGFAGLRCAKNLQRYYPGQVELIDKNNYHMYWPLLYKLDVSQSKFPIKTKAGFIQRQINDYHDLDYDYLVIATGSDFHYCGIEGLQENALILRGLEDAEKILQLPKEGLVIVGAGVSGVELAAELAHKYHYYDITLVEASSDILPSVNDERFCNKARKRLEKIGIKILINHSLIKVEKNKLYFKNGEELGYQGLIWAGGVKLGAYQVDGNLKVQRESDVFAIGDCASIEPGMVDSALRQAKIVAINIKNSIEGKNLINYQKKFLGMVIPLGGCYAVGKIGNIVITGWLAWLAKELIHFYYKKTYV